jgi:hypothetical protein
MSHDRLRVSCCHQIGKAAALFLVTALALAGLPHGAKAETAKKPAVAGLAGSWSGGGSVSFASGAKEQARCRARYLPAGKNSYTVNATCATASGKAAQTATVRQVGENVYAGSFYNTDYAISGTVHIVVRGSSQTIRLVSDSASAVITLSR